MRKVLLLTLVVFIFSACKKDYQTSDFQKNGVIGKWKLTESLSDPGD